jgi:hypothetical protein
MILLAIVYVPIAGYLVHLQNAGFKEKGCILRLVSHADGG